MNAGGDSNEVKDAWLLVETNLKGTIKSREKLKYALQCTGRNPSQSAIENYWKKFGGSVTYSDFSKIMKREKVTSQSDLMSLFKKLDRNRKGFMTTSELKRLLMKNGEPMSEEEVELIVREVDTSQDGKVDFTELCHLILETTDECVKTVREKSTKKPNKRKKGTRAEDSNTGVASVPSVLYKSDESVNNDNDDDDDLLSLSSSSTDDNDTSSELPVISPTSLEDTASPPPPTLPNESDNEDEGQKSVTFKTPGEGEPVKPVERVVPVAQSEVSVATTATATTEITEETIEEEEEEDDEKEENSRQQTDHLSTSPASSVDINVTPKPPPTVQEWNIIQGKGCFYVSGGTGDIVIESHHFILTIPERTQVWIEMKSILPGNPQLDVSLYVFHMTNEEEPDQYIIHTQHRNSDNVWVSQLSLEPGSYILLPYTTGCVLLSEKEDNEGKWIALLEEKDEKLTLTQECISVLTELFHRHDLDSSDSITQNELEFFFDRAELEYSDDDDEHWKVIQESYEVNDESDLLLNGFLKLNEDSAAKRGKEGGEEYLRSILLRMGYNKRLKLAKACPFEFEVYTESCEGEIEILSQLSPGPHVERALASLAKITGSVTGTVEGADKSQLITLTLVSPAHITAIFIENKTDKDTAVKVDCSQSKNCLYSNHLPVYDTTVPAHFTKMVFHLVPRDLQVQYEVAFLASVVK